MSNEVPVNIGFTSRKTSTTDALMKTVCADDDVIVAEHREEYCKAHWRSGSSC